MTDPDEADNRDDRPVNGGHATDWNDPAANDVAEPVCV